MESEIARRRTIIAVIFGAHLVATLFFLPPEDIINDRPILTLDHALHFYQAQRAREVFTSSGGVRLYDPYFYAGHPGGMALDLDAKSVELWCSILGALGTARSYKLFIIFAYLIFCFGIYAGCRRLQCGFPESVFALLFVLVYWHWGRPYAGQFRYAGMFSYLLACCVAFYLIGLFASLLRGERVWRFYILGPIAFFIHPTSLVLLPVPFLALYFSARRHHPDGTVRKAWEKRTLAGFALWCSIVLAANAFWLAPVVGYLNVKAPFTEYFQLHGIAGLFGLLVKPSNLPALPLFAFAIAGCVRLVREKRVIEAAAPAVGSIFLFLLASFGASVPIVNEMEPGRFIVPAILFLAPLAGIGYVYLIAAVRKLHPGAGLVRASCAAVFTALILMSTFLALVASREYYRYTLTTTNTTEVCGLIDTLREHTNSAGRLMIEDGPVWKYGHCLLPAILPLATGIEQIGGPYPYSFLPHSFAAFQTCRAFGHMLMELDAERFREYLELYNVHWILTATAECRAQIERLGAGAPLWQNGAFTLWKIEPPFSYTEPPGIGVRASYNEIRVTIGDREDVTRDGILLKYHWDGGLEVSPPARIYPRMRMDDPVPFILLEPSGEREIRIRYRRFL